MPIKIYRYTLKGQDGVANLAQTLARYFPKPEQSVTGIHELLLNAVEHGNLGIGFNTKTGLIRQGKWKEEVARRLALPEYSGREVEIELSHDAHECRLVIADQGKGFPWKEYLGRSTGGREPNGRGLWIAFNVAFDRLLFNAAGNEVTCVGSIPPSARNAR
jgi:anti-sigma regulatory factor (Ser/Thr protein kinase)